MNFFSLTFVMKWKEKGHLYGMLHLSVNVYILYFTKKTNKIFTLNLRLPFP